MARKSRLVILEVRIAALEAALAQLYANMHVHPQSIQLGIPQQAPVVPWPPVCPPPPPWLPPTLPPSTGDPLPNQAPVITCATKEKAT